MNKVYLISYKRYNNPQKQLRVLAKDAGDAFEKVTRYLKRTTYSTENEITEISFECQVDVIYKS